MPVCTENVFLRETHEDEAFDPCHGETRRKSVRAELIWNTGMQLWPLLDEVQLVSAADGCCVLPDVRLRCRCDNIISQHQSLASIFLTTCPWTARLGIGHSLPPI
jgi:hypothetical protein